MDNKEFLFLFNAVLLNASNNRSRQSRLLYHAVKHGHISLEQGKALHRKHDAAFSPNDLHQAENVYKVSQWYAPDPDDQLDQQQIANLEPPQEFEQDPMNPCGATDPRF